MLVPNVYPRSVILPQAKDDIVAKVTELDLGPIAFKLMNPDRGEG